MRINKIMCDRCGAEIKEHPVHIFPEVTERTYGDVITWAVDRPWKDELVNCDFCNKCTEEIIRFAKSKPDPQVLIIREPIEEETATLVEAIKKEPVAIPPAEQPTVVEVPKEQKPTVSELILQGFTKKEVVEITGCKPSSYDAMKYNLKKKGLLANSNPNREPELDENGNIKTYNCNDVKKKCFYGAKCGSDVICDYIGIEGHSRGCRPEKCDKFRKK